MKSQNISATVLQFLAKELLGGFLYWPVWWYSVGLRDHVRNCWHSLHDFETNSVGLTVWIVNWTRPMFAQRDVAGKIISFFMRTVIIIGKSIQLLIFGLIQLLSVLAWVAIPLIALWQLAVHLFA